MILKQYLTLLLFATALITTNAQQKKENNLFKKQDVALLDLLFKDSTHSLKLQLNSILYSFGLDNKEYRNIALVKEKRQIWIQPLGSGKLFEVKKSLKGYELQRIDSTIHSGVNSNSYTFLLHDTIFQYGGSGFWHLRGIITYFSKQTHEWELYPSLSLIHIWTLPTKRIV